MKVGIRIFLAAAMAFALSACGGSGAKLSNKDDAAKALFGSFSGSQASANNAFMALPSAVSSTNSSGSGTATCRNGNGKITVSFDLSATSSSGNISVKYSFDGCEVGDYKNAKGQMVPVQIDGDVTYALVAGSTGTLSNFSITIDGHLDFSGGIDDSLDISKVVLSATADSAAGTYALTLTGDLKTNEGSFHYDQGYSVSTNGQFTGTDQP